MELPISARSWRTSWYFALGAGCCGVLLPVFFWLVLGKPYWLILLSGETGWTIYPPLSALPHHLPGNDESIRELLVASVCGGLFLAGWLRAWRQHRRTAAAGSARWFWWSLLLLLPLFIQVSGISYTYYLMRNAEANLLQEFQQTPLRSTPLDSSEQSSEQ